jgi:hypothetical protein
MKIKARLSLKIFSIAYAIVGSYLIVYPPNLKASLPSWMTEDFKDRPITRLIK